MNTKIVDLEVDYIDSRSITKEELAEISEFIRRQKHKSTNAATRANRVFRRKKVLA